MSIENKIKEMFETGKAGTITLKPGIEIRDGRLRDSHTLAVARSYPASLVSMDNYSVVLDMPPAEGMVRGYTVRVQKKKIEDIRYN